MIANIITTIIILAFVAWAVYYIIQNRKKGVKCIGCPYSQTCGGTCSNDTKIPEIKEFENENNIPENEEEKNR